MPEQNNGVQAITKAITDAIALHLAGDISRFKDAWTKSGVIVIDDFSPFIWSGDGALESWIADAAAHSHGITCPSVKTGDPLNVVIGADGAAVVVPVFITYNRSGESYQLEGLQFYVLRQEGKEWKIQSMTHSGPPPVSKGKVV